MRGGLSSISCGDSKCYHSSLRWKLAEYALRGGTFAREASGAKRDAKTPASGANLGAYSFAGTGWAASPANNTTAMVLGGGWAQDKAHFMTQCPNQRGNRGWRGQDRNSDGRRRRAGTELGNQVGGLSCKRDGPLRDWDSQGLGGPDASRSVAGNRRALHPAAHARQHTRHRPQRRHRAAHV